MIYQPRVNKAKRRKTQVSILLALFFLVVAIVLSATSFGQSISGSLSYVLKPFIKGRIVLTQALEDFPIKSRGELTKENRELTAALDEAQAKLLDFSILKKQNDDLRNMLGRAGTRSLVLSAVLSKPNLSPYDTVLIDKGKDSNLASGMLVLAYGNIPIGKISEVYINSSLVRLFSSPGEENSVTIGTHNIQSSAKGMGSGNFIIVLPKDTGVVLNDAVRLPGIDPNIIGTVEKIESSDTDTFARVLFKSPVDIYELRELFVATSQN